MKWIDCKKCPKELCEDSIFSQYGYFYLQNLNGDIRVQPPCVSQPVEPNKFYIICDALLFINDVRLRPDTFLGVVNYLMDNVHIELGALLRLLKIKNELDV